MSFRFWVLAAAYHGALVAVCVLRARRWRRREALAMNRGGFWRWVLGDLLSCGTAAFLLAFPLAAPLPDPPFAVIRFWAQALFGEALLYLLFLAALHWRGRLVLRSLLLALAALALLAVYVDAYHVEPRLLRVEEHELALAGGLPAGGSREIRLLHISDIQASRIGEYERRVVKLAAELEPDIVVLTGDYIHERLLPTGEQAGRELAELLRRHGPHPPLGIWAVGGDTDGARIEHLLVDSGIGWLDDEVVTLPLPGGPPLTLVGLAPGTSRGGRPETLRRLVSEAPPHSPRIVFGHAPDYVLELVDGPQIELALAGHTHGGQIVMPFFGPPLTLSRVPRPIAAGGLHELGRVRVHVSRGVGMERGSAPQVRFLCPPEICVLTLRY
jgi:predicted MPP superfamily phosphohydrolase